MYWIGQILNRKEFCMIKNSRLVTIAAVPLVLIAIMMGGCPSSPSTVDVFWDTSLLQNVTRLTDDGLEKHWARVSPDGSKMLYCEFSKKSQWNVILLRDVTVPAKTPLVTDYAYAPAWYNNNNNFLYVTPEGGSGRIIRSAISGGGKTYVTRNSVGKDDHHPSVRGEVILFDTETNNGNRQIVSMKDNGTEITILGDGHSPSWHPSQAKFVFIREDNVYEMDLASLQVTELFSDPKYRSVMPSYSADGGYILFQKGAEEKITGTAVIGGIKGKIKNISGTRDRWQIFIIKADGTGLSPITLGSVNSVSPSWDVNNFVYFVSNASGKTEIYRARVNLN
jgi:TolB protein